MVHQMTCWRITDIVGRPSMRIVVDVVRYFLNKKIRQLDRAADGNSNVPVIVNENMSYIKGGYYLDKDKNVKKIKPQTAKT